MNLPIFLDLTLKTRAKISNFTPFKGKISKIFIFTKIVSFLDKANGAGLHYFQDCRTPQPCCKEKWRIQYGRKAKSE